MAFEQTWRWFGPNDPVTLVDVRQTGATGVVTALHHIPTGEVWTREEIRKRKTLIESEGLTWAVVESLPVHDDIKRRSGRYRESITNYGQSIRNLAECDVRTVCYNFMPVLDWSRTSLTTQFADGSITTQYEPRVFAAFDLFVLKRPGARESIPAHIALEAEKYFRGLNDRQREELTLTILLGFPGSGETYQVEQLRAAIESYAGLTSEAFRGNLREFLKEIIPVAEEVGVSMALHPDDPPWPVLGLPRAVSSGEDLERVLHAVDSPSNGITLCTGSLGAGRHNDVPSIAQQFASRVNFVHLRNVATSDDGTFIEENHLEGDVDVYEVMKTLLLEQQRREKEGRTDTRLPMRPDHGHLMRIDQERGPYYPGYSLFGRMRGLAELRGLELGIRRSLGLS